MFVFDAKQIGRKYGQRQTEFALRYLRMCGYLMRGRMTDEYCIKVNYLPRKDNWHFDDPERANAYIDLKERYRLRASAQTYYQREAYQGLVEEDVRICFDSNLIGLFPGEKLTGKILTMPVDFGWNDVGGWQVLSEVMPSDRSKNVCLGKTLLIDSKSNIVKSTGRLIALLGWLAPA